MGGESSSSSDAEGSAFPFPRFGEMLARTPTMASGYWADPAATAAAFTADGFYRTGDLCEARPDGSYAVVDRVAALALVEAPPSQSDGAPAGSCAACLVSPAAVELRLQAALAAAGAAGSDALPLEHLCCVVVPGPPGARGGRLVAAVCVAAGATGATPAPQADALLLASMRAAAAAAGLRPAEVPSAVLCWPRRKWEGEAGEGGLINVQHKVVRGRVAAEAMAQLQSLGDSAAA